MILSKNLVRILTAKEPLLNIMDAQDRNGLGHISFQVKLEKAIRIKWTHQFRRSLDLLEKNLLLLAFAFCVRSRIYLMCVNGPIKKRF